MNERMIVERFLTIVSREILDEVLEEKTMDHYRTIKINNAPMNLRTFTVCRVFEHELWFYGTYDEESVALKAAREINGVIVSGKEI